MEIELKKTKREQELEVGDIIEFNGDNKTEHRLIIFDSGRFLALDIKDMCVANAESSLKDMQHFYSDGAGFKIIKHGRLKLIEI